MALDVINGINGYITDVRGTATQFVRASAINGDETVLTEKDFVQFEAAKTAGATVAGTQTVDFGGTLVGGNDAGLVTATYTATIVLDGTSYPISIPVTTADTVTVVVAAINADLPGTELAITGGNLVVTSPTTGNASYVVITDVDIFSGMTGYVALSAAVDGGTGEALKGQTLDNGQDGFSVYASAYEVYDTGTNETIVTSKYTVADLNATFSDVEVEAELAALKVKVDALQELVLKILN
jgi:cold shock CspA family protein